jgi:BlaI family transcriptional regulator, penicillinase repressor
MPVINFFCAFPNTNKFIVCIPFRFNIHCSRKEIGWNMNTTYTLIKRCIKKGAIERSEPNFMCHALIPKEEVQEAETKELVDKIYDGSVDKLFAALLGRKKLSAEQIQKLKQIVEDLE